MKDPRPVTRGASVDHDDGLAFWVGLLGALAAAAVLWGVLLWAGRWLG